MIAMTHEFISADEESDIKAVLSPPPKKKLSLNLSLSLSRKEKKKKRNKIQ